MSLKFKTSAERDQYAQLGLKTPKLVDLLIDLTEVVRLMFLKDVTITSVYRSPEEQAELYKASTHKVVNSPHMRWQAVDLRSRDFTQAEIDFICNYLNTKYKNSNGKPVAFCHAIAGGAPHFHIQLTG